MWGFSITKDHAAGDRAADAVRPGKPRNPGRLRGAKALALAALAGVLAAGALLAAQFTGYPQTGMLYKDGQWFPPENMREHAEWTFARFKYDLGSEFGFYRFQRWEADYPKADRQFVLGVKRLTRIDTRSKEHVVDADSDVLFNYPWIYVEDPGAWHINAAQAKRLREYIDRGGFIMLDDSWGEQEWSVMANGVHEILPGRPIVDLPDGDPLFNIVYNLGHKVQIPGTRHIWGHRWRLGPDESTPRWSAVRDDKGRIVIAICQNSDVGDAWEWADSPQYPQPAASQAYRIGVNYIIYSMTH
jgi:Domain of unknown function (DUF4159)